MAEDVARLAIVDDHDSVRAGIKAMLSGERDFQIVAEAADGREALELCQHERPELVLMDVRMDQMDGLEATREIKQRFSDISVLILTMHANQDYLLEAIRAGAAGYVLKEASQHELAATIRKVLDGETVLDQELATQLLRQLAEPQKPREQPPQKEYPNRLEPLTPREIEVLELAKLGQTNRQISQSLYITPGTAKNHMEHIIAKLGVSDRTQAVVRALELGIIGFS